jgi:hypothetical protein
MMMATGTQLVQLASFFAGADVMTQTSKNDISCVDANRQGDFFAVGVHKRIKVCHVACPVYYIIFSYYITDLQLQGYFVA